ncbi:hypothetical protein ACPCJT_20335 [Streptomyces griseoincarnatus]|jgi:hypothetical protein
MTNPADELRQAAQTLMDLADAAQTDLDTGDYWKPYAPATAWRDGLTNGMGGTSGDLAAVFSPATAHALALLLRGVLSQAHESGHEECSSWCSPETCDLSAALAVARQINAASA